MQSHHPMPALASASDEQLADAEAFADDCPDTTAVVHVEVPFEEAGRLRLDDDGSGGGSSGCASIRSIDYDEPTLDVLTHPDVLASVMGQLGLRRANLCAAVCTAWRHASLCAQEEQRVLRPSHSLGWGNEALGQFRSPSGIIMLPSGELCVADTNNHRLQVRPPASREWRGEPREEPPSAGQPWVGPIECRGARRPHAARACEARCWASRCHGTVALASVAPARRARHAHHVRLSTRARGVNAHPGRHPSSARAASALASDHPQVLSRSGEVRGVVGGGPGQGSGEFQQPTGLACDRCFLYVADSGNCRIHKLSLPEMRFVTTIGSFGEAPGLLHAPVGLALHDAPPSAVAGAGSDVATGPFLFCADSRNHRIAVFATTPELAFIRTFGTHGSAEGEFGPTSSGIYLAAYRGLLYVADRANHRLQVAVRLPWQPATQPACNQAPPCARAGVRFCACGRADACRRVRVRALMDCTCALARLSGLHYGGSRDPDDWAARHRTGMLPPTARRRCESRVHLHSRVRACAGVRQRART